LGALLCACEKSEAETAAEAAAETIADWVEDQLEDNAGYVATYNGGVVRLTTVTGSGDALESGGSVNIFYAGYNFTKGSMSSSTLFATNISSVAEDAGWSLTDATYEAVTLDLSDSSVLEGLRLGLEGAQAGEECYILFTGENGFGKKGNGTIPANAALAYYIQVDSLGE